MATGTLAPGRAIRQPRRVNARAVLGVLVGLAAFVGATSFWVANSDARGVIVVTRELPAGRVIEAGDLTTSFVRVDDGVFVGALPASEAEGLVGKQLSEPAHAQQILSRGQLSRRPLLGPDQLAFSVAIAADSAAGGRIRAGDAVEVFLTTDKGRPEAKTSVVLESAVVYDVGYDANQLVASGGGAGETRTSGEGMLRSLTLAVSEAQAKALARAKWSGELDVALRPATK